MRRAESKNHAGDMCTSCEGHSCSVCAGEHMYYIVCCHNFHPHSLYLLKTNTKIENPNTWSVIQILNAKSFHTGEICKQIVEMYGEGAVYKVNVRKLCWFFKEGMTIHDWCCCLNVRIT